MAYIDPHVHCRDWNQVYKATIASVIQLARSQGVVAIFDMPNTDPPIISGSLVNKRLELAQREGCLEGYYVWIGVIKDPDQIKEAVQVVRNNPRVVGMKMYAGRSVGDLAIISEEDQKNVYQILSKEKYEGVLAVHCEKESLFLADLWKPENPYSWTLSRPPEMEIDSIGDQISFAKEAGFEGTLHIAHISTPKGVRLVSDARRYMKITCGVTPHHLTMSSYSMKQDSGLLYKVNPPLRSVDEMEGMQESLKRGEIDWIETDHAPHIRLEKLGKPYLSGIPSLEEYRRFISWLSKQIPHQQVRNLTYDNIKRVFPKVLE